MAHRRWTVKAGVRSRRSSMTLTARSRVFVRAHSPCFCCAQCREGSTWMQSRKACDRGRRVGMYKSTFKYTGERRSRHQTTRCRAHRPPAVVPQCSRQHTICSFYHNKFIRTYMLHQFQKSTWRRLSLSNGRARPFCPPHHSPLALPETSRFAIFPIR